MGRKNDIVVFSDYSLICVSAWEIECVRTSVSPWVWASKMYHFPISQNGVITSCWLLFFVSLFPTVGGGVRAVWEGGGGAPGVRQSGPAADRRPMPRHPGTSRQRPGGQLLTLTHTLRQADAQTHSFAHSQMKKRERKYASMHQTFNTQSHTQEVSSNPP